MAQLSFCCLLLVCLKIIIDQVEGQYFQESDINFSENIGSPYAYPFFRESRAAKGNKTKSSKKLSGRAGRVKDSKRSPLRADAPRIKMDAKRNVDGVAYESRQGRTYYGYLGIPYGKVNQRFGDPEPDDRWEGTHRRTDLPPFCLQFQSFFQRNDGVEDCLTLTVYTSDVGAKRPVMVWTSPGGFQMGGSKLFKGAYMMDEDIVLVSINNRLGALGFLNTMEGTVSGNMGLKDQVLALKWVQKNIHLFGGDKDKVTFAGLSCGGASVQYHLLSPMSQGLFKYAISQSGSVLNPWAFQPNPEHYATQLGRNAGCSTKSMAEIVDCLRKKSASQVVDAQRKLVKYSQEYELINMHYTPSVEVNNGIGQKFLLKSPIEIMNSGAIVNRVPWMVGFVENEGGFYLADIFNKPSFIQNLNTNYNPIFANTLYYEDHYCGSRNDLNREVTSKVFDFYVKSGSIDASAQRAVDDIYSDRLFLNGIAKSIKIHAKHQSVYPYVNNYQAKQSGIQYDFKAKFDGMVHADDMNFLFDTIGDYPSLKKGTPDGDFSIKYVKMITAFMKTGRPDEKYGRWPTASSSSINYFSIDFITKLVSDPYERRRVFWDSLPLKEHEKGKCSSFPAGRTSIKKKAKKLGGKNNKTQLASGKSSIKKKAAKLGGKKKKTKLAAEGRSQRWNY